MKLELKRFKATNDATLGRLYVDDVFECYTLEDEYREVKVAGETRIPAGTYNLIDRKYGGFYNRYSVRFAPWHKGMIQLEDVPNFTDVLIHCGNTDEHTAGCILVGKGYNEESMTISQSARAYEYLYKVIYGKIASDHEVILTITDEA